MRRVWSGPLLLFANRAPKVGSRYPTFSMLREHCVGAFDLCDLAGVSCI